MLRSAHHLLTAALLCAPAAAQDASGALFERGRALVSSWQPTDYEGHEQNWAVIQDSDGILLVANQAGLMEYDGERWSYVEDSLGLRFRGLVRGPDGVIYATATSVLGYLEIGAAGRRRFVPLAGPELAPLADVEIDQLLLAGNDLLFSSDTRLFAWRGIDAGPRAGQLYEVPIESSSLDSRRLNLLGRFSGLPLVYSRSLGLLVYEDGELLAYPSEQFAPRTTATGLVTFPDGEGWITTLADGLWRIADDGVTYIDCEASTLLARSGCTGGLLLSDGRVAFASAQSGLVLCDRAGNLLEIVDRDTGLSDSTCLGIPYEDDAHGCWLPLSFGLARYEAAHRIESFDFRDGLDGPVLCMLRHGGSLWAGTFTGLFRLEPTARPSQRVRFTRVAAITASCFDLAARGEQLLVASSRGLEVVEDGQLAQVLPLADSATEVLVTRAGVTLMGTFNAGMFTLHSLPTGSFGATPVEGTAGMVRWLVEDPRGRVWFVTGHPGGTFGIARLEADGRVVAIDFPAGVPVDQSMNLFGWRGELHATTDRGMYLWNEASQEFALDERFGDPLADQAPSSLRTFVDQSDRLWLRHAPIGELQLVQPTSQGAFQFLTPLSGAGARMVHSVLSEQDGRVLWAGDAAGRIVRLDLGSSSEEPARSLQAPMIRTAELLGKGSLLDRAGPRRELPWSRDTLRFEFAAPRSGLADQALFQTRLSGLEQSFGPWSRQSAREFAGLREGHYEFEVRTRDRSGTVSPVASFGFRISPPWYRTLWAYAGGLLILALGTITFVRARLASHLAHVTRLRAEIGEREAAERRYRALVEDLDDWVMECDGELRLTYSSPRVSALLGRTPESVVGHTLFEFMEPAQADEARSRLAPVLARSRAFQQVDLQLLRAQGGELEVEVSGTPERAGSAPARWRLVARDVTARRSAEEQRRALEDQLRETRRLEALGRLAGGISHDFNNLLTALLGNSYLLRDYLGELRAPLDAGIERCLDSIDHAGQRAADLTSKLLSFSRKQVTRPVVFPVSAAIARLEGILRRVIREDIELVFDLESGDTSIEMDPGQFDNAILNLVINARDALPEGGAIVVGARTSSDPEDGSVRADVYVSDNGVGMDRATQERIFEPFFTTKDDGRGTGLGLASVHGIVKQAGGTIRVESAPAAGTTMHLSFRTAQPTPGRKARPRGEVRRGSGWVLVCEDEESIRGFIEQILTASGYHVLLTATPDEALQAAAAHDEPIDLLLTDVVLPGRNGRELAEELCRSRPSLRVLFMSGYSDDVISHRGVVEHGVEFIAKPFRAGELLERLGALR